MALTKENYISRKKNQLELLLANHLKESERLNKILITIDNDYQCLFDRDDIEAGLELNDSLKCQLTSDAEFLIKESKKKLTDIKMALLRIQQGNYLNCSICANCIPAKQLNHSPTDHACEACTTRVFTLTNKSNRYSIEPRHYKAQVV